MKYVLGLLVVLLSSLSLKADILVNGDFKEGKAHWKGDIHLSSDQASYDMSTVGHSVDSTGLIIDLKSSWTKVYQTFNTHENAFSYSITYQLSADFASLNSPRGGFPPMGQNRGPNAPNPFLSSILGGNYSGDLSPPKGNSFTLLVVDMKESTFSSALIPITPGSTAPQTITGTVPYAKAHDDKTLYLVFPAGKGSVTLLNVTLTPGTGTPAPQGSGLPGIPGQ